MSVLSSTDKLIRKLRKKLRQIENLEFLGRANLNEEELLKVKQKNAIRIELTRVLKETGKSFIAFSPEIGNQLQTNFIVQSTSECTPKTRKTPETKTKQNIQEDAVSISISKVPLQEKVKPVENLELAFDTSVTVDTLTPFETMKRPSTEEAYSSLSHESPAATNPQMKRPKPESSVSHTSKENKSTMHGRDSSTAKAWHETPFLQNTLESHNDIVCCVDIDDTYIISGSRDTLVQVWCAKTGSALINLRGHSNTVTCVSLLSPEVSKHLNAALSRTSCDDVGPRLAVTGSLDCCLKLWNIENGSALSSIYTFSGVTALCYLPAQNCCVVGSEGGKLETYTFLEENTNPLFSTKTFENPVSHIKLQKENLICSSLDGSISVWTMKGTGLCRLFRSDDLVPETGHVIRCRPILSLSANSTHSSIFYGDEGATVKMLTWKTGCVKKLKNHVHDFGITNAIYATKSFLISSSINLDTGNSSVNIRSLPNCNYLGTLNVSGIERVFCLAATEDQSDQSLRLVIGGTRLLLLETRGIGCRRSPKKDSLLKPQLIGELASPARDSEEDFSSSSDEESEEDGDGLASSVKAMDAIESSKSTNSWCIIL